MFLYVLYSYVLFLMLSLDCPQTDIAFLLDGSGSVNQYDFNTMKNFVISMINEFKDRNFQACAETSLSIQYV